MALTKAEMAERLFEELGLMEAEGFQKPCRVFSLRGSRAPDRADDR